MIRKSVKFRQAETLLHLVENFNINKDVAIDI
jgi:hypothetical protein